MKITKRLLAIVAALGLLVVATPGCSTTGDSNSVAQSGDPIVVSTETTLKTAFTVIDGFLLWEHQNRPLVGSDVTKAADAIRGEAPQAFQAANAALLAYKKNRTPDNRAELETWLALLLELQTQAITLYPK